jgi:hypothetical protein
VRHATPIPIPEHQFLLIAAAASWLCPSDRDQFWAAIAAELAGCEIGEGAIARAVRCAFRIFYKPIEVPDEPHQLRKLTYGERKLEQRYEEIFDGNGAPRSRRQRSDAR